MCAAHAYSTWTCMPSPVPSAQCPVPEPAHLLLLTPVISTATPDRTCNCAGYGLPSVVPSVHPPKVNFQAQAFLCVLPSFLSALPPNHPTASPCQVQGEAVQLLSSLHPFSSGSFPGESHL